MTTWMSILDDFAGTIFGRLIYAVILGAFLLWVVLKILHFIRETILEVKKSKNEQLAISNALQNRERTGWLSKLLNR